MLLEPKPHPLHHREARGGHLERMGQFSQGEGRPIQHYWLQFHAAEEQVPEMVLASPGQMTLVTVSPPTLAQCPV